jgi:hypothetical protein
MLSGSLRIWQGSGLFRGAVVLLRFRVLYLLMRWYLFRT